VLVSNCWVGPKEAATHDCRSHGSQVERPNGPSDVVQEVLAEAARKLPGYVGHAPLPFYPWLRQIAWDHLVKLHRDHMRTQKRSALRERHFGLGVSDQSALALAEHLMASGTSPSGRAMREELRERVRRALGRLDPGDREILVMRHLEQLQISEIAALLAISEGRSRCVVCERPSSCADCWRTVR